MFNIIKTDFYIMKGTMLYIVIYNLLFPLFFKNTAAFIPMLIMMTIYVFVMGIFAVEERDNIITLQKTLPVKAAHIVGARYVEMLLLWLLASAVQFITCTFFTKTGLWDSRYMLYSLALAMFFMAISIPVTYHFGQAKSRIPVMLIWIVGSVGISPLIVDIELGWTPLLIATAVFALLTVLSWHVSALIFKQKA